MGFARTQAGQLSKAVFQWSFLLFLKLSRVYFFDIAVTLEEWNLLKLFLLDVNCVEVVSSSRGADFLQQDGLHHILTLSLAVLCLLTWRVFSSHGVGLE